MQIKGVKKYTENVEIEIAPSEINRIVSSQSVACLAEALRKKLLSKFLTKLTDDVYPRVVRQSFKSGKEGKMALVHVEADWDYHNNVGIDREVRLLTDEEVAVYNQILGMDRYILSLEQKATKS